MLIDFVATVPANRRLRPALGFLKATGGAPAKGAVSRLGGISACKLGDDEFVLANRPFCKLKETSTSVVFNKDLEIIKNPKHSYEVVMVDNEKAKIEGIGVFYNIFLVSGRMKGN